METNKVRKVLLMLVAPFLIALSGCESTQSVKGVASLKDGYFKISKAIDDNEKISKEYVKNLLNGYEYKKGEEFRLEDYSPELKMIQQPYIFKNDKEELTITHITDNGKESLSTVYNYDDGDVNISLSYSPADKEFIDENTEPKPHLFVGVSLSDNNKYQDICKILNDSYSDYESYYQKIADNFATKNDMNIEDLKSIIGDSHSETTTEKVKVGKKAEEELISYKFEKDKKEILVEYFKNSNKMFGLSYIDMDSENMETNVMKNARDNKELEGGKFHMGLINFVDKLDEQEKMVNKLHKYMK
ncbi:hypothetical protein [Clostridium sp. CCUG 7971]|uniref:hypothetical protein n=1 Tax=Clostridium sp. CCUG 7971 TaxID=2811414 RepID=UPI001ABA374A|nr:hypothetical protein [Clostridium sp. CCUG 7971]MBO3445625.1 hypothetical protein [Clostridium sp. CCUG 7971]